MTNGGQNERDFKRIQAFMYIAQPRFSLLGRRKSLIFVGFAWMWLAKQCWSRELLAKLLPQNTICEFALSFGSSPALGCSHSHSKLLAGADNDDDDYDDDDDDDFDDHD